MVKIIRCPNETFSGADKKLGLFLAGGITACPEWQDDIITLFKDSDLCLLNPRRELWPEGNVDGNILEFEQVTWENQHLKRADAILFWFPKESVCPITLYELGYWAFRPKKLFIGIEPGYIKERTIKVQIGLERPQQFIHDNLENLVNEVLDWEKEKKKDSFYKSEDQPHG